MTNDNQKLFNALYGTIYQRWNAGTISGLGSFHTELLNLYRLADAGNRERLDIAFPEYFVKTNLPDDNNK